MNLQTLILPILRAKFSNAIIVNHGMSLRDFMAANVLNGYFSNFEAAHNAGKFPTFDEIAISAYAMADAMMKVRGK